jgi:hypothetical protein
VSIYPAATPLLLPESRSQPKIRPAQMIFHSLAAPWTIKRMAEYWQSTNLEAHFGVDYSGAVGQFVDTYVRADANYGANARAISVETASNVKNTDTWTPEQVRSLISLGAWAHETHGIPARVCRTHDDPGFGVHRLFPQWAKGGSTYCPGDARFRQFHDVILPGIVRATTKDDDMPTPQEIAVAVWDHGISDRYRTDDKGAPRLIPARALQAAEDGHYDRLLREITELRVVVDKLVDDRGEVAREAAKAALAGLAEALRKG